MSEDALGKDSESPLEIAERRGNPERVLTFTDGVFAIIITILVLEIVVPPDLGEESLRSSLDELAPSLVAWVISFLITGMYWVWHRDVFTQVRVVNRQVIWLNLLFLLPVALIPFGASLLGEYHDEPIALHVYGGVLIASSLMRTLLYWYLSRQSGLLWATPDPHNRRVGLSLAAAPIVVYALAMAVANVSPTLSVVFYLSVPLLYFAYVTFLRSRPDSREEADDFS